MQVEPAEVHHNLSLVFTIAVVVSVTIQAIVFVGIFFVIARTIRKVEDLTEALSGKALPLINDLRVIVEDAAPKIKKISGDVADVTASVREQTLHVNETVDDVVDRTHAQARKVDEMVSAVIGSVAHAGSTINGSVRTPGRKISAVWNGVRAGFGALRQKPVPEPFVAEDVREVLRTHAAHEAHDASTEFEN